MKTVKFVRSPYGGFDGWVNGKLRYDSHDDIINLSSVPKNSRIIIESHYGTVGWKQSGMAIVTTTATGLFDFGAPDYEPLFSRVFNNFQYITIVNRNNWRTIIEVTRDVTAILASFKILGILAFVGKR